jgi:hypothetical protein
MEEKESFRMVYHMSVCKCVCSSTYTHTDTHTDTHTHTHLEEVGGVVVDGEKVDGALEVLLLLLREHGEAVRDAFLCVCV